MVACDRAVSRQTGTGLETTLFAVVVSIHDFNGPKLCAVGFWREQVSIPVTFTLPSQNIVIALDAIRVIFRYA
jgi:hypothetical protein